VTAQGLSRIAGGVALAAVLVIAGLVARSVFRGPEPEFVPQLAGGPATGDMSGFLDRIDRTARTIDVAGDLVGLRPVSLAVTHDTSITVLGKPGSLADLSKDMPVRVFYEVRHDVKYVTAIQVTEAPPAAQAHVAPATGSGVGVGGATDTRPADNMRATEPKPVAEAVPAGDTRSVGEARPVLDPKSAGAAKGVADAPPATAGRAAPAEKAVVAATTPPAVPSPPPAAPPATTPSMPRPAPPVASPPAQPPATRAPSSPPPPAQALAPAKASQPVASTEGTAGAAPRRPAESDVADGTAAIDWLLKESGRR
jgi:hypothetical protein